VSHDECIHGMPRAWCSLCEKAEGPSAGPAKSSSQGERKSKQALLNELCDLLGLPRQRIGVGSSLPSEAFEAAAELARVPAGSMPEIGERVAARAGLSWRTSYDSRSTPSGGGSTVTREGLEVVVASIRRLSR